MSKKVSKYFYDYELLPKGYIDTTVLHPHLLILIDEIRELIGFPLTINANGRQYCGFRAKECPIGAINSYHKRGMAADLHSTHYTAEEMRKIIKEAVKEGKLKHLGGVELDVSWLHVDVRPRINNQVLYFKA